MILAQSCPPQGLLISEGDESVQNDNTVSVSATPLGNSKVTPIYDSLFPPPSLYNKPRDKNSRVRRDRICHVYYKDSLEPEERLVPKGDFIQRDIQSLEQLSEVYYQELSMKVGGRLSRFWKRWRLMGASPFILNKLQYGLRLDWVSTPPVLTTKPNVISRCLDRDKMELMRSHVTQMLIKGAIQLIQDDSPGFYSRIFMVPKQGGKWRPVIDLSALNKFVNKSSFKMETPERIRESFRKDEWITSLDLTDAYFHMPVAIKFRKFMRFVIDNRIYEFLAMPFGLSTAPKEFTDLVVEFKKIASTRGFHLNQYLDDWINRDITQGIAQYRIWQLLQLVVFLGFVPNYDKSSLIPSRQFDFLGGSYDLQAEIVKPTTKRVVKVMKATDSFREAPTKTVRQFMSLIGLLNATVNQVSKLGRMHLRPIQWHLGRIWSHGQHLDKKVLVPESLSCHFAWWGCKHHLTQGVPIHVSPVDIQLVTDSSEVGWGAHCQGQKINGIWEGKEASLHINYKELKTVLIAMRYFSNLITDRTVLVLCDNTTAVSYIKKQGGLKSHELYKVTFSIYSLAESLKVDLQVRHVAGALNVIADRLSRQGQNLTYEWSLHPVTFKAICEALGTPQIDMFATEENHKLPIYCSPIQDPNAFAIDALSCDWSNLHVYAYPPSVLISKALNKATRDSCKVTLVAPLWIRAIWIWDLIHASTDRPLKIAFRHRLLAQYSGCNRSDRVFDSPLKYEMWNLHVWSLDFRPNIVRSLWWNQFQIRKLVAPADYNRSMGEERLPLTKLIELWLDTGTVG